MTNLHGDDHFDGPIYPYNYSIWNGPEPPEWTYEDEDTYYNKPMPTLEYLEELIQQSMSPKRIEYKFTLADMEYVFENM